MQTPHDLGVAVQHHHIPVRADLSLHVAQAGPSRGPLVVLLHGFPELWYAWRRQFAPLARAGYRVVAPDMRGYNTSDKPPHASAYTLDLLTGDIARLIERCNAPHASVIGHDWGAIVAWRLAMDHPQHVQRLSILNVPHPAHYRAMASSLQQLRRSLYILLFQLPHLPEHLLRRDDFAAVRRIFTQHTLNRAAFTDADVDLYVQALSEPGALTATLNYYRALLRTNPFRQPLSPITCPTQVIWGAQDPVLGRAFATPPPQWVPNARTHLLPDASHWPHNERPERVNALLLEHLADTSPRPAQSAP